MQCTEYSNRSGTQWNVRLFGQIRKSLELKLKLRKLGEQLKKEHDQINLVTFEDRIKFEFGPDIQAEGSKAIIEKTEMHYNEISHSLRWNVEDKEVKLEGFGENNIKFDWRFDCPIYMVDEYGNIQKDDYGNEVVKRWIKSKNPDDIDVFMKPTRIFSRMTIVFGTTEEKLNLSQFIQNRKVQLKMTKQDVYFIIYDPTGSRADRSFMLNANNEAVFEHEHTERVAAHVERTRIQEIKMFSPQEEKEQRPDEERRRRSKEYFDRKDREYYGGREEEYSGRKNDRSGSRRDHVYERVREDNKMAEDLQEKELSAYNLRVKLPMKGEAMKMFMKGGFATGFPKDVPVHVNWDVPGDGMCGDKLLSATFPSESERNEIGNQRRAYNSINEGRDWNIFNKDERTQLKNRNTWSPSKQQILDLARSSLDNEGQGSGPPRTSTPKVNSKTEEYRKNLQDNVREVDSLSASIDQLQLESSDNDEELDDEILLNDFTTTLGALMPTALEGTYQNRLDLMMDLTRKTGEVFMRKSRRLAKLAPERREEIENKTERRRLHWKSKLDDIERELQKKNPKNDDDDNRKENDDQFDL